MLGIREPQIYGSKTYEDLKTLVTDYAGKNGIDVSFFQSNHEGDLIDAIQKAYFEKVDGIVFNPAAYTHTSIAIADALKGTGTPTVEVHISDLSKREAFRQVSYIRDTVIGTVTGKGLDGYNIAIDMLMAHIKERAGK